MGDAEGRVLVGVVVPTRNSARTLEACLCSLRCQTVPCVVAVVDNHSTDSTQAIARQWADVVVVAGPERSRQRNLGAAALRTPVIGFVDSDMVLDPGVAEEAVGEIGAGMGAVVVPERTVGVGYWVRVRAFERSLYQGQGSMEAARFFTREAFEVLGGFDEELAAAEDWDLGIRARALARIGRTKAGIDHDEGRLTYRDACRKKGQYAVGVKRFVQKHGRQALATGLDRPWLRRPWLLAWPSPSLGAGLLALKVGETTAMTAKLSRELVHRESWE